MQRVCPASSPLSHLYDVLLVTASNDTTKEADIHMTAETKAETAASAVPEKIQPTIPSQLENASQGHQKTDRITALQDAVGE